MAMPFHEHVMAALDHRPPARLLRVAWDPAEPPVWHQQHLTVDPTGIAALAIRAPVTTVRYRNAGWPDSPC